MIKSEPLGFDIKNIVDGMTGIILWLEIQERKDRIRKEIFLKSLVELHLVL